VKNTTAGAISVTVATQRASNYGDMTNLVVSVPATSERTIGVYDVGRFAADVDGLAVITAATQPAGLTFAALRT
jgi:hypothetical protein